jgi:hypothetical protein
VKIHPDQSLGDEEEMHKLILNGSGIEAAVYWVNPCWNQAAVVKTTGPEF